MQRRRDRRPGIEPDGDPDNLPSREDDEVWIAVHSLRGANPVFHTEPECHHLLGLTRVRVAPRTSVREWDCCSTCRRVRLPDRDADEVWVAVNQAQRSSAYHTDADCYRLQQLDRDAVRTVSRAKLTGVFGDLDECTTCDEAYHVSQSNRGAGGGLAVFLKREDVTPDNYRRKLQERENDA